jgi:hypothetical protein
MNMYITNEDYISGGRDPRRFEQKAKRKDARAHPNRCAVSPSLAKARVELRDKRCVNDLQISQLFMVWSIVECLRGVKGNAV